MSDTIGHLFKAWDGKVYRITERDQNGFWIEELGNAENRRNISTRAVGRTFHHDRWCECDTGLKYPEGLTTKEYALLSVFDAGAYDMHRAECRDNDVIPPMWLCMSDEARQEAREKFHAKLIDLGMIKESKSLEDCQRYLNAQVWYNGAPDLAEKVSLWREAEAGMKREREGGNPRAYFAG